MCTRLFENFAKDLIGICASNCTLQPLQGGGLPLSKAWQQALGACPDGPNVAGKPASVTKNTSKIDPKSSPGLPGALQGTQETTRQHLEPPLRAQEQSQSVPGTLGASPGVLRGVKKSV